MRLSALPPLEVVAGVAGKRQARNRDGLMPGETGSTKPTGDPLFRFTNEIMIRSGQLLGDDMAPSSDEVFIHFAWWFVPASLRSDTVDTFASTLSASCPAPGHVSTLSEPPISFT